MKIFQAARKHELFFCFFVFAAVVSIYLQVMNHEFVSFDDPLYITKNIYVQQGLTTEGFKWAFGYQNKVATWHPLTWLFHMAAVTMFGKEPGFHLLMNSLWHLLNIYLLFFLLHKTTRMFWPSTLVAFLFAVHPVNVESVAWVSELKNLLSAFFWLLTMVVYVWYTRSRSFTKYLLLIAVFVAGLLAKPILVTLPFILLLLDYWPLERLSFPPVASGNKQIFSDYAVRQIGFPVLEKIPLVCISILISYLATQSLNDLSNLVSLSKVPLSLRIENIFVSYVNYLSSCFWPADLAVYYPFPRFIPLTKVAGSALILGAITYAILGPFRKKKYLTVGWLWFLITLVPVSGLIQAGLWPAMADRYAYIPFVGLFIIVAWSVKELYVRLRQYKKTGLISVTVMMVLIFGGLSWRQVRYWQDSETLFKHTLAAIPRNFMALNNLGTVYRNKGEVEKAIEFYRQSLDIDPNYLVYNNLGNSLVNIGQTEEAIANYKKALALGPERKKTHYILGLLLFEQDRNGEAVEHFERVLAIDPGMKMVHHNIGDALTKQGQLKEANKQYVKELEINPESAITHIHFGMNLVRQGRPDEAVNHYKRALLLEPDNVFGLNNIANVLARQGKIEEAINFYRKVIQYDPNLIEAQINLANAYVLIGEPEKAVIHYRKAKSIDDDNFTSHYNFANALLKSNMNEEAIQEYSEALVHNNADEKIYFNLGIAYLKLNQTNKAVSSFEDAVRINPHYFEAYRYLGLIFTEQGNLEKSIYYYLKAVNINPQDEAALLNLAFLFSQTGKYEFSVSYFTKALTVNPENAEIHFSLANSLSLSGRVKEAKKHYVSALKINPDFANAHINLGILLAQENQTEQAISHFSEALRIDPVSIVAHTNMGIILFKLGERDEALYHFQEAARINPENQQVRQFLRKIEQEPLP